MGDLAEGACVPGLQSGNGGLQPCLRFLPGPILVAVEVVLEVRQTSISSIETLPETAQGVKRLGNLVGADLSLLVESEGHLVQRGPDRVYLVPDRDTLGYDHDLDGHRLFLLVGKELAGRSSSSQLDRTPSGCSIVILTLSIMI